jgi:hypothetical protein
VVTSGSDSHALPPRQGRYASAARMGLRPTPDGEPLSACKPGGTGRHACPTSTEPHTEDTMTQPTNPQECATCPYRRPAGLITITSSGPTRTEPACLTCAAEALTYYASHDGHSARFTPDDRPNELCC